MARLKVFHAIFSVKVELELLLFGSSVPVPLKLELIPEVRTSSSVTQHHWQIKDFCTKKNGVIIPLVTIPAL